MSAQLFHWADYVVFVAFLAVSVLIGLFFGYRDRKKMTSKNFLTGGRNMHWSLVALSMQASFLSAIFIISIPYEVYAWGTMYYYLAISYFLAYPFAGHFIMPVYYKMNVTSAYEYLQMRFNRTVRVACAITFTVQILLYLSVVLYTPALALAQVTNLEIWTSIVLCGLICTFYTVFGGMKATMWNDFFQMLIIGIALIILLIFGVIAVGGWSEVWSISKAGGRIDFDDFRINPTIRTTFWTQVVGGFVVNLAMYAANQTSIQKYISVRTLKDAKKSVWMASCLMAFYLTLVCLLGLVAYAYYASCDPLLDGVIDKKDQLIPLFVMNIVGHLHGLPGLFIAAAFSAALSSISGSLNALSAVTLTDFINPVYTKIKKTDLDEKSRVFLSRVLTLSFGLLVTILGFAAQYFGQVVVQVAFSIFGFVGGPLTCVVLLGMFFPFVTSLGVMCGLVVSLAITSWIAIGSIIIGIESPKLPLRTDGCENSTFIQPDSFQSTSDPLVVYELSFMYYGLVAIIISFPVAILVSLVFGRKKTIDPQLIMDWKNDCCCCCMSQKIQSCLRCGVELSEIEENSSISSENSIKLETTFENLAFDQYNEISITINSQKYLNNGNYLFEGNHIDQIEKNNHFLKKRNGTVVNTIKGDESNSDCSGSTTDGKQSIDSNGLPSYFDSNALIENGLIENNDFITNF